jgi:hypothetical protein
MATMEMNRAAQASGAYSPDGAGSGVGWSVFAGTMIIIGAMLNFLDGVVAIANAKYFQQVSGQSVHLVITDNLHTWGWVTVGVATVMLIAGFAIFMGAMWARVLGIIAASLNLIFQLAFLAHYPFWSLTMIIVDMLVIYGLAVHGGAPKQAALDLTE